MYKYSFIIRNRNEARWIGHCIQSLIDFFGDEIEIIIVDNESKDESLQIVRLFMNERHKLKIKIVNIPHSEYTPGKAINLGFQNLKSPDEKTIVGIISAHVQILNFDKKLASNLLGSSEKCFGLTGKQTPIYLGKKIRKAYTWEHFKENSTIENMKELHLKHIHFYHNAFSFNKYSVWQENPFDELVSSKEDRYWADELTAKGYNFYYEPSLACNHHWTPNGATWQGIG
tara:strand:- start:5335 stop:6021 length:687 start_codon:yes stop_codon:yes gene_type:complete